MSHFTIYQLLSPDGGKVLLNHCDEQKPMACFSNYDPKVKLGRLFKLHVLKEYPKDKNGVNLYWAEMILSREQVLEYLKDLEYIFPHTAEEKRDRYIISFSESSYYSAAHIRAALDYFRGLYETWINKIPLEYLKAPREVRYSINSDPFLFLQATTFEHYAKCNNGHCYPSMQYSPKFHMLHSAEELKGYMEEFPASCYSYNLWKELAAKKNAGKSEINFSISDLDLLKKMNLNTEEGFREMIRFVNGER